MFSADGRTLWFSTAGSINSGAVHAYDLVTGRQRFVIDGDMEGVVETGPYAGAVIVARHGDPSRMAAPSHSIEIVRQDGEVAAVVSTRDPPEPHLRPWLRAHRSTARFINTPPRRCR
jgi:hypothetical protein